MSLFSKEKLQKVTANATKVKKHKILLVDDELANLKVMSSILSISYEVLTAENGVDALHVIDNMDDPQELNMIISDQRMPKMTGVELFEHTVEKLPDVLRVIVSGYSDIGAVISAINKAHIFHFISKPFERAELLMTVKQSLKTYDLKKQMEQEATELKEQLRSCKEAYQLKDQQLAQAMKVLEGSNLSI
jgi:two-component system cell cycle response regulator